MKRSGKCNQKHKREVQVLLHCQELLASLVVTCKNITCLLLKPPVLLDVVPCSDKESKIPQACLQKVQLRFENGILTLLLGPTNGCRISFSFKLIRRQEIDKDFLFVSLF